MNVKPDEIGRSDEPAYKAIASHIENQVASGALRSGDALPNESDLAARFGVNRSTIRESLRLLEDTGHVRRISPRKLVASMPNPGSLADRMLRALHTNGVTLREIYETSLCLEPRLARYAAERAAPSQIDALRQNIVETQAAFEAGADLSSLDETFHSLVCDASNQKAMLFALEPYKNKFQSFVNGLGYSAGAGKRLLVAHSRIFEAIERRDGEVAELWARRHIEDFERGCATAGVSLDTAIEI